MTRDEVNSQIAARVATRTALQQLADNLKIEVESERARQRPLPFHAGSHFSPLSALDPKQATERVETQTTAKEESLNAMRRNVESLDAEIADLRQQIAAIPETIELLQLVTLDQAAAVVHKSKRTLERRKTDGDLPTPMIEGGAGKADQWDWRKLRPWLESEFGIPLPDEFPASRIH